MLIPYDTITLRYIQVTCISHSLRSCPPLPPLYTCQKRIVDLGKCLILFKMTTSMNGYSRSTCACHINRGFMKDVEGLDTIFLENSVIFGESMGLMTFLLFDPIKNVGRKLLYI